jgi:hypothetical protein
MVVLLFGRIFDVLARLVNRRRSRRGRVEAGAGVGAGV